MKYLKLYEEIDFDEDDFEWLDDELSIGDKIVPKIDSYHYIPKQRYEKRSGDVGRRNYLEYPVIISEITEIGVEGKLEKVFKYKNNPKHGNGHHNYYLIDEWEKVQDSKVDENIDFDEDDFDWIEEDPFKIGDKISLVGHEVWKDDEFKIVKNPRKFEILDIKKGTDVDIPYEGLMVYIRAEKYFWVKQEKSINENIDFDENDFEWEEEYPIKPYFVAHYRATDDYYIITEVINRDRCTIYPGEDYNYFYNFSPVRKSAINSILNNEYHIQIAGMLKSKYWSELPKDIRDKTGFDFPQEYLKESTNFKEDFEELEPLDDVIISEKFTRFLLENNIYERYLELLVKKVDNSEITEQNPFGFFNWWWTKEDHNFWWKMSRSWENYKNIIK